jgi:hypothetical protein
MVGAMGRYLKVVVGTLLVFIGIGALAPAALNLLPGTVSVHYSDQAVPRLLVVAAVGGAAFVAGIWTIMSTLKFRKR